MNSQKMPIILDSGFDISYFSDLQYEEMTVEIGYAGQPLAQINRDHGVNKLQIEIYSGNMTQNLSQKFKFDIEDFLEALHKACSLLEDN
jgi:hypothetical protein